MIERTLPQTAFPVLLPALFPCSPFVPLRVFPGGLTLPQATGPAATGQKSRSQKTSFTAGPARSGPRQLRGLSRRGPDQERVGRGVACPISSA
ncbi:hypothetical protein SAMN04489742_0619 [Arthrobacter crystallopoietes]|uniref:Uncharacterized protein n=1 Tax=Crystallibacter crystallopoietes TaxID=37928 RepID=A0A1H0ZXB0_9MICC|nr:hypothetical protein SAMN04489742_0619 [Arthrobacter crystallopoietes]